MSLSPDFQWSQRVWSIEIARLTVCWDVVNHVVSRWFTVLMTVRCASRERTESTTAGDIAPSHALRRGHSRRARYVDCSLPLRGAARPPRPPIRCGLPPRAPLCAALCLVLSRPPSTLHALECTERMPAVLARLWQPRAAPWAPPRMQARGAPQEGALEVGRDRSVLEVHIRLWENSWPCWTARGACARRAEKARRGVRDVCLWLGQDEWPPRSPRNKCAGEKEAEAKARRCGVQPVRGGEREREAPPRTAQVGPDEGAHCGGEPHPRALFPRC